LNYGVGAGTIVDATSRRVIVGPSPGKAGGRRTMAIGAGWRTATRHFAAVTLGQAGRPRQPWQCHAEIRMRNHDASNGRTTAGGALPFSCDHAKPGAV
jgi:hypothetical protein